jgi:MoaA/NifB/PqqE/SkfB family radical SAM enzyme
LDQANLAKLLDTPIDILAVSIAGTTAATSDRWRMGNDFTRLGEALQELKCIRRERKAKGPRVHIAYMLLASNWREVEALPVLAHDWDVSEVVVNNLSFIADAMVEKESLFERPDLWRPVLRTLKNAKRHAAALGIDLYYYRPDKQEPHPCCTENVLHSCFVSYRGDVSPCVLTNFSVQEAAVSTHLFRGRVFPVERFVFGNLRDQSLGEIWDSGRARAFRAAFEWRVRQPNSGHNDVPEPCRHCYKLFEV